VLENVVGLGLTEPCDAMLEQQSNDEVSEVQDVEQNNFEDGQEGVSETKTKASYNVDLSIDETSASKMVFEYNHGHSMHDDSDHGCSTHSELSNDKLISKEYYHGRLNPEQQRYGDYVSSEYNHDSLTLRKNYQDQLPATEYNHDQLTPRSYADVHSASVIYNNGYKKTSHEYNHGYTTFTESFDGPFQQHVPTTTHLARPAVLEEFPTAEEIDQQVTNESLLKSDDDVYNERNSSFQTRQYDNGYLGTDSERGHLANVSKQNTDEDCKRFSPDVCSFAGGNVHTTESQEVNTKIQSNRKGGVEVKFDFRPMYYQEKNTDNGNNNCLNEITQVDRNCISRATQNSNLNLKSQELYVNPSLDRISLKQTHLETQPLGKENETRTLEDELRETTRKLIENSQQFARYYFTEHDGDDDDDDDYYYYYK